MSTSVSSGRIPDDIPANLVRDVDFYALDAVAGDVHLAWKKMADANPPVFWTPRNGGHWVATHPDDIVELQTNHKDFSMTAAVIPRQVSPSLPVESDPPYHTSLRAIISPLFVPETLASSQQVARELAINLIEDMQPKGKCDFVKDYARQLPIAVFLKLMELPFDDKDHLLELAEVRFRTSDAGARERAKQGLLDYLRNVIEERRARPGPDFISKILHANVDERQINEYEAEHMLATLLSGGLDTVAAAMGFAMRFLAMNPGHRRQLIENPSLVPNAVDELMRRHGISNTARLIMRDRELRGAPLKAGEQILGPHLLYGLSEEKFERPFDVDFKRKEPGRHAAFGNGPHRCPGANLARMEIRLTLEEWLRRIPDFELDPEDTTVVRSGIANALLKLPLIWKP